MRHAVVFEVSRDGGRLRRLWGTEGEQDFNLRIMINSRCSGRLCICKSCEEKGFSSKDTSKYTCERGCGCELGHRRFKPDDLKHHKNRGTLLLCARCREADEKREANLKRVLRMKDAWKCTCKEMIHGEKCQLHPRYAGERRWAGTNKNISEDDLEFLAKRRRQH